MNIKQALKKKNILVEQIKQEFSRATMYNSIESGNARPYSAKQSLDNYLRLTEDLIELKTAIHKSNQPIYDKIFRLSEYKSIVKYLKTLNCIEGKTASNRWNGETESKVMEVEIGIVEKDKMVEKYESLINDIQDELDYFNQTTELKTIKKWFIDDTDTSTDDIPF